MSQLLRLVLPLILLSFFVHTVDAQNADVSVCRFKDDKLAAISLTFDDGLLDHDTVVKPLLEEYGYKATFYVVVNWADHANDQPTRPNRRYMNWEQIKSLADAGHEIGNHSMKHYQLTKAKTFDDVIHEINDPITIFNKKLGFKPLTFCFPGNARNEKIFQQTLIKHINARTTQQMFGGKNYTHQQTVNWVDRTLANKQWGVAMIHAILEGYGWAPFPNGKKDFIAVLDLLKQHDDQLWIDTFANVSKYVKLRDDVKLQWIKNDQSFMLKTDLDTNVYDLPLTVKITVNGKSRSMQVMPNTTISIQ